VLRPYSDEQLNQGFWFLLGASSDAMRGLTDQAIAWDVRERCIRSFETLSWRVARRACLTCCERAIRRRSK